jgi:LPS-assembly lipoprotein
MNLVRTSLIVLLSSLCLSACGFRLAGTTELPTQFASIYLQASNFSETQRKALRRTLKSAGATLITDSSAEATRLIVDLKTVPDQQMATSASSGEIVKRISRSLNFHVKAADGNLIAPVRTLRQQKDITLDENNLLASNRERETVVLELEQALYDQLVRQLARI